MLRVPKRKKPPHTARASRSVQGCDDGRNAEEAKGHIQLDADDETKVLSHGSSLGSSRSDLDLDGNPVRIVVDHIKPISKHWHLRLDPDNLQVLCNDCNKGKGAWDETDYRPQSRQEAMIAKQLEYSV